MNKEQGLTIVEGLTIVTIVVLLVSIFLVKFALSEQVVSGIVYNNTNNAFISGNTRFSVRASENTYVSKENQSSYCLPPGSKYINVVNKAARDKNIKVIVTTRKYFTFVPAPWICVDNVKVELKSDKN